VCSIVITFYSDEILTEIGTRYKKTLLSLEIRSCSLVTDTGIIELCEGLSGIKEKRAGEIPTDDHSRYRFYNKHETSSILKYLNMGDLKQLTVSMRYSICTEQSDEGGSLQPVSSDG
jgi:hypothetical protein